MTNSDKQSYFETLNFCQMMLSEKIIKVLEEVSKSGVKEVSIEDELYKKHHNLLKHRYNLDQIAKKLK